MARQPKEAYYLTDAEQRDLIAWEIPTNADEYMRLRDALGRLADSPRFNVSSSP